MTWMTTQPTQPFVSLHQTFCGMTYWQLQALTWQQRNHRTDPTKYFTTERPTIPSPSKTKPAKYGTHPFPQTHATPQPPGIRQQKASNNLPLKPKIRTRSLSTKRHPTRIALQFLPTPTHSTALRTELTQVLRKQLKSRDMSMPG